MESLPLKDILASILKEFEAASVNADVSREHWRQVYESNALLKDFSPSRLKITEASITLPLAFAQIGKPKTHSPVLTSAQLLRLLPTTIPMDMRSDLAHETASHISKTKRLTFASKKFTPTVMSFLSEQLRDKKFADLQDESWRVELVKNLNRLRDEFLNRTNVNSEREAMFSYQTEELSKLASDRITRFEIKLAID